jgi:hypothetical protein
MMMNGGGRERKRLQPIGIYGRYCGEILKCTSLEPSLSFRKRILTFFAGLICNFL